jgi:carboxymethylenebutenolidase
VLANYGGEDAGVNKGIPATAEAMKKYSKSYDYKVYPGAGHAFNNDTGNRYNPEASKMAWERTLAFLKENLS